jgi:short-subunit dehydrogenase
MAELDMIELNCAGTVKLAKLLVRQMTRAPGG